MTGPDDRAAADRWDAKYEAGPGALEPAALLGEIADLLPGRGTMLDVAGGSGRNALWFARHGYECTVVDVSRVGLSHALHAAHDEGLELETLERDVEGDGLPGDRRWDVVLMHLFYYRDVLRSLPAVMSPGGVLVFAQPTTTNLERNESPPARFLPRPGEVATLVEEWRGMEILMLDEAWRASGRHEVRVVARREAGPTVSSARSSEALRT